VATRGGSEARRADAPALTGSFYFTADDVEALWDTISSMTSNPDANEFMRSRIDDGCHRRCSSEDWSADR
jgi:hypothetical protein